VASINHTKCRRRQQTFLPFPSSLTTLNCLCCRFFFWPSPCRLCPPKSSLPHPAPRCHRLRVIPVWSEIPFFFYPPSWRFAKIHSSSASEGAKGTPQKPARREKKREKERKKPRRKRVEVKSRWRIVIIVIAANAWCRWKWSWYEMRSSFSKKEMVACE